MKPLYKLVLGTIIIGVIALGINTVFGNNTITYLTYNEINGVGFYKYDFWNYVDNIRNTIQNTAQLELHTPTRTWIDNLTGFGDLGNNLALMLDWFIFANNILLYPLRVIFYVMQITMSIIGIPTIDGTYNNNPLKWLIDLTKFMTGLEIPFV